MQVCKIYVVFILFYFYFQQNISCLTKSEGVSSCMPTHTYMYTHHILESIKRRPQSDFGTQILWVTIMVNRADTRLHLLRWKSFATAQLDWTTSLPGGDDKCWVICLSCNAPQVHAASKEHGHTNQYCMLQQHKMLVHQQTVQASYIIIMWRSKIDVLTHTNTKPRVIQTVVKYNVLQTEWLALFHCTRNPVVWEQVMNCAQRRIALQSCQNKG